MYMIACAAVVGLDAFFEGLVGYGEEGVHTKHRLEHRVVLIGAVLYKIGVLFDPFVALLLAVAVGDLVAQA